MTANISDAAKVRAFWDSFKITKSKLPGRAGVTAAPRRLCPPDRRDPRPARSVTRSRRPLQSSARAGRPSRGAGLPRRIRSSCCLKRRRPTRSRPLPPRRLRRHLSLRGPGRRPGTCGAGRSTASSAGMPASTATRSGRAFPRARTRSARTGPSIGGATSRRTARSTSDAAARSRAPTTVSPPNAGVRAEARVERRGDVWRGLPERRDVQHRRVPQSARILRAPRVSVR